MCSIFVLLKFMVGYLSISRKLDPRRSRSRCSLWVRMLAVWIVAEKDDFSGCSGSSSASVVTSLKWPRTVIIPRCLAENSTWVCIGSNFQVVMFLPPRSRNRLETPLISNLIEFLRRRKLPP